MPEQEFDICIPAVESTLASLAKVIEARFVSQDYKSAQEESFNSGDEPVYFYLRGKEVMATIRFEPYASFLNVNMSGQGETFEEAKIFLTDFEFEAEKIP